MTIIKEKHKNFYTFMNNKLKSRVNLTAKQGQNGLKDENSNTKANGFSNEFASYFTVDNGTTPVYCLNNSPDEAFHDIIVSKQIVLKHLQNLNKNSAAGPDGLPGIF